MDNDKLVKPRPPTFEPTTEPTSVYTYKNIKEPEPDPVQYKLGQYINSGPPEVIIMYLSIIVSVIVLFIIGSIYVYKKCKRPTPPVQDSGDGESSENETYEDIQDHGVSSIVNPALAQVIKEV
jgi:hypothetical protein